MATKGDGTTVRVVVEFRFKVQDAMAAKVIADNAESYGLSLGTNGYSIWEFSPEEAVLEATTE
jgi:hypothetical protein